MKTLAELGPQVGEVVVYIDKEYEVKYKSEHQSYLLQPLSSAHWKEWWVAKGNIYAENSQWSLKPKETQVTIADLNLSVGDRVQQGRWTGTVTDTNSEYVVVLWDWSTVRSRFPQSATPSLTLLPKPEPTLADLDLKAGDPVLNTRNGRCALVYAVCYSCVNIRYCCGDTLTLFQSDPATRLKKLEVPK